MANQYALPKTGGQLRQIILPPKGSDRTEGPAQLGDSFHVGQVQVGKFEQVELIGGLAALRSRQVHRRTEVEPLAEDPDVRVHLDIRHGDRRRGPGRNTKSRPLRHCVRELRP